MGFLKPDIPPLPPLPPPPEIIDVPDVPALTDAEIQEAAAKKRAALAGAQGRSSTLLGGSSQGQSSVAPTLLGG